MMAYPERFSKSIHGYFQIMPLQISSVLGLRGMVQDTVPTKQTAPLRTFQTKKIQPPYLPD
jgi:hypothetical protein